jgi:non-homologous end joining protein Ku
MARAIWSGAISFGPADRSEKVYSLLLRAIEHSGLAGIAKFVMRDRQNLGALHIRDGVIILEQMSSRTRSGRSTRSSRARQPSRRKNWPWQSS